MTFTLETVCAALRDRDVPSVLFTVGEDFSLCSNLPLEKCPVDASELKNLILNHIKVGHNIRHARTQCEHVILDTIKNVVTVIPNESLVFWYFRGHQCGLISGSAMVNYRLGIPTVSDVNLFEVDSFSGDTTAFSRNLLNMEKIVLRFFTKNPPKHIPDYTACRIQVFTHACNIGITKI